MSNFLSKAFSSVASALNTISGVQGKIASLESIAQNELLTVAEGASLYEGGHPIVLGTISERGHAGKIVAIADGSELSVSLGLSGKAV